MAYITNDEIFIDLKLYTAAVYLYFIYKAALE